MFWFVVGVAELLEYLSKLYYLIVINMHVARNNVSR